MAMRKPKTTKPTTTTSTAKAPGVIAAIRELLLDGTGYTTGELYAKLAERFPERAREGKGGMKTTITVQLVRQHKQGRLVVRSEQVERGTVYSAELPPKA